MQTCRHCGGENQDGSALCAKCGLDLGPSPIQRTATQVSGRFFRLRAASLVLAVLTVMFGVLAPLNLWLGAVSSQRGDQRASHALYSGAFWNAVVAILCFGGRRLMRRQIRVHLVAGACA